MNSSIGIVPLNALGRDEAETEFLTSPLRTLKKGDSVNSQISDVIIRKLNSVIGWACYSRFRTRISDVVECGFCCCRESHAIRRQTLARWPMLNHFTVINFTRRFIHTLGFQVALIKLHTSPSQCSYQHFLHPLNNFALCLQSSNNIDNTP